MILPPKVSCENSTKANIGHAFSRRLVCQEARASQEALSANPTKQTYIQYKLNTGTNNSPTTCPAEGRDDHTGQWAVCISTPSMY